MGKKITVFFAKDLYVGEFSGVPRDQKVSPTMLYGCPRSDPLSGFQAIQFMSCHMTRLKNDISSLICRSISMPSSCSETEHG